jgi:hypothetical protein
VERRSILIKAEKKAQGEMSEYLKTRSKSREAVDIMLVD